MFSVYSAEYGLRIRWATTVSQSQVDTLYCGFDPLLLVRLVLRVRSPLANSHSTAGSIPSCQPKCAVVLLRIYTRLGNVASLVACSMGRMGAQGSQPRSLGYMDPQWKPSMRLPSATGSVACSLGYGNPQGNPLCVCRAPQGPFLCSPGYMDGQGSLLRRSPGCMDAQGSLPCRSPER